MLYIGLKAGIESYCNHSTTTLLRLTINIRNIVRHKGPYLGIKLFSYFKTDFTKSKILC